MENEFKGLCPWCNAITRQTLVYNANRDDFVLVNPGNIEDFGDEIFVAVCKKCNGIWIGSTLSGDYGGSFGKGHRHIYYPTPNNNELPIEVPESIRSSYREAIKVKDVSSLSFAVMIRRSLEFVCNDKGANGKTLEKKIEDLYNKGLIPNQLFDLSTEVRKVGK
ncbi:MAG: DUF4145 domain-containing protein [Saprospirales bacterium]|nr:DUF4145 domain-containing protein [Saprospirales bacterium]